MFNIAKLFNKKSPQSTLTKDQIAELLKTTPEALEAFEAAYQSQAESEISNNFFDVNAKDAVAA